MIGVQLSAVHQCGDGDLATRDAERPRSAGMAKQEEENMGGEDILPNCRNGDQGAKVSMVFGTAISTRIVTCEVHLTGHLVTGSCDVISGSCAMFQHAIQGDGARNVGDSVARLDKRVNRYGSQRSSDNPIARGRPIW